ncbi:unnamed protein product [Symbiodinium sp. CCMP2592]|nr:unnamed protein product [Symbiodinium sp. CCMP2592]
MPSQRLPLFPCICVALAMTLLAITLLGGALPEEDEAFVSGATRHRGALTQMQARKFTAADRGTPEYEEYMRNQKQVKKAAWDMMTTANGYRDVGIDVPVPAPAPAPAPSPSFQSAPAPSGGGGGNPFQFLVDLFNPTTTTTTTTPPPNPIEAFFKSLR